MSKQRRYDDDEQNVFDERGTLLRGKIRVPLAMMDSVQRAIAAHDDEVDPRCTTHDAAGYEPGTRPGFVLADSGSNDAKARAYADHDAWLRAAYQAPAGIGPERHGDAVRPEPPRTMTKDQAYDSYEKEIQDAWRGREVPEPRKNLTTEDAYLERNAYLENAWRGDGR